MTYTKRTRYWTTMIRSDGSRGPQLPEDPASSPSPSLSQQQPYNRHCLLSSVIYSPSQLDSSLHRPQTTRHVAVSCPAPQFNRREAGGTAKKKYRPSPETNHAVQVLAFPHCATRGNTEAPRRPPTAASQDILSHPSRHFSASIPEAVLGIRLSGYQFILGWVCKDGGVNTVP